MNPLHFQSGPKNHRYKPPGTVRVRRKRGRLTRPVVEVKVADDGPEERRWRYLSQVVWESARGPVPPGLCIWFRNRDPLDCRLANLELITRGEAQRRNIAAEPERFRAGWARGGRTQCARPEFRRRSAEARRRRAERERKLRIADSGRKNSVSQATNTAEKQSK